MTGSPKRNCGTCCRMRGDLRAIRCLYAQSENCIWVLGSKLELFSVRFGIPRAAPCHQSCSWKMECKFGWRIGAAGTVLQSLYRTRLGVWAVTIVFLRRAAGVSLGDRVRSPVVRDGTWSATATPCIGKEPVGVVLASGKMLCTFLGRYSGQGKPGRGPREGTGQGGEIISPTGLVTSWPGKGKFRVPCPWSYPRISD